MKEEYRHFQYSKRHEYQVSNLGNIKVISRKTGKTKKIYKGNLNKKTGYLNFICNGFSWYVHRAIAKAFNLPVPTPDSEFVDHINSNRQDNRVCNLRYVTRQQNNSTPHAIQARKETRANLKKTDKKNKVLIAKKGDEELIFLNQASCAKHLNVSHVAIICALKNNYLCKGYQLFYKEVKV